MTPEPMSRRAAVAAIALYALAHAACLAIAIDTRIARDGSVARVVSIRALDAMTIDRARERFPSAWSVERGPDGRILTASVTISPGGRVAPDDTQLSVTVRPRLFCIDYEYREDFGRLRLGSRPPTIAPVPPARGLLLPWLSILAHEKNLAVIERRLRESITVGLSVEMPGRAIGGSWQSRDGSRLHWDFNFRVPAAPHAASRVYRRGRIAAAGAGGLIVLGGLLITTRRVIIRRSSSRIPAPPESSP